MYMRITTISFAISAGVTASLLGISTDLDFEETIVLFFLLFGIFLVANGVRKTLVNNRSDKNTK